jgi:hypothetical protein
MGAMMAAGRDRIELTTAVLFDALQRLARELRLGMTEIDRGGGAPTALQVGRLRAQVVEFQSVMAVLDRQLPKIEDAGAIRQMIGDIAAKLLVRALGYEAAYAISLDPSEVPLFGAVTLSQDLRQLDQLARQVQETPADLEARVAAARDMLQTLIKRCPEVLEFR